MSGDFEPVGARRAEYRRPLRSLLFNDTRMRRFTMRNLVILGVSTVAVAFALVAGTPQSHAYEGPWCARTGGSEGYVESCSMRSLAMCLSEIRGSGGNAGCAPNPNYRSAAEPASQVKHAQHQR